MSLDFINPSYPATDFFPIEELITKLIVINGNPAIADTDLALLRSLLLPFATPEWTQNAVTALAELLENEKADPADVKYYLAALEELCGHVNYAQTEAPERLEAMLTVFFSAYHLAFYEYSEEKLVEVGWLFKSCLADNVDPSTRGAGSYPGYIRRLQDYIGGQLALHKDLIRQQLLDAQTKSVFAEPELAQLLQPSSPAIVPLSQNQGVPAIAPVALVPDAPSASTEKAKRSTV